MSGTERQLGRTLVTGAAGFLGGAVARRLRALGQDIVCGDITTGLANDLFLAACDITDTTQIDGIVKTSEIDTIIHCGAVSGPMVMPDQPESIWRINTQGTANVLNAARRHAVGRVVLCSSIDVYGLLPGNCVGEDSLPAPQTVYGASKVAGEAALLGFARQHGVDGISLRFSWIYGPGRQTPTELEALLQSGLSGVPVTLASSPSKMTHYLFVDDAIRAVLSAATAKHPTHRIYNVTAGDGIMLKQVVDAVEKILPQCQVAFFRADKGSSGPSGFDTARAFVDLGFKAEVALTEGIARYVEALGD